jgi:uncharacterized membrane protein
MPNGGMLNGGMLKSVLRALAVLTFFASVAAAGQSSADRAIVIEGFDATISVATDGTIFVQETITARFEGAWNGIYRTIPVEYRTPQGLNYALRLGVDSVTDDRGNALRYETSRERHYRKVKIWVPNAADTTRIVKLGYHVPNALRFFDEHDELYWNITGDEWDVPIRSASATILLPPPVSGIRAAGFRGSYGSTAASLVQVSDHRIRLVAERLGLHEGLTTVVGWNPGVVHRPTTLEQIGNFLYGNWQFTLPFLTFAVMWVIWWFRGRDPNPGPVATMYEPPQDMTPGDVGALIDGSVDMRDITATLVDLAVRGYVRIEEVHGDRPVLSSAENAAKPGETEYAFTSLKPHKEWNALKTHESLLLAGIFEKRDHVTALDLKNEFYKYITDINQAITSNIVVRDFYLKNPGDVIGKYATLGVLMFASPILWFIASGFLDGALGFPSWTMAGAAVVSGLIVMGFAGAMPARTKAGTREYEKVKGFQEFLSRVDADRLQRIVKSPELFEKYLPYAMALGVETEWAAAFKDIYTQSPQWYSGTSGIEHFNVASFTAGMHQMSTTVASSMASAPRDVGGSGFGSGGSSGGGFSGGGFGGGGGGGF